MHVSPALSSSSISIVIPCTCHWFYSVYPITDVRIFDTILWLLDKGDYASMCVCMCVCMYVHVCACVCVCMCWYVHACVHVCDVIHQAVGGPVQPQLCQKRSFKPLSTHTTLYVTTCTAVQWLPGFNYGMNEVRSRGVPSPQVVSDGWTCKYLAQLQEFV